MSLVGVSEVLGLHPRPNQLSKLQLRDALQDLQVPVGSNWNISPREPHSNTYVNPGGLEVIAVSVRHGAEAPDSLHVLWLHLGQPHRRGEHGEVGQRLDVCISLQLHVQ